MELAAGGLFEGVSGLSVSGVLARFTYDGDADFDVAMTGTDYSLIDNAFAFHDAD